MFHEKRIVVVMPAYNAARTIEMTYREIPLDLVDEVDDIYILGTAKSRAAPTTSEHLCVEHRAERRPRHEEGLNSGKVHSHDAEVHTDQDFDLTCTEAVIDFTPLVLAEPVP